MARSPTHTFVTTIPLCVKPHEDKFLMGCMEAATRLYNTVLQEGLRRRALLVESKAWQKARKIRTQKARSTEFRKLSAEAGFTAASLTTFARMAKNAAHWQERLGSNTTQALTERCFSALEQFHFGKRGKPRFKGKHRIRSLEGKNNLANIIWKRDVGFIQMGNHLLPAKLPTQTQDPYLNAALQAKTKYCRVLWKRLNGKRQWFAQLMQEGKPPRKYETIEGAIVGLDVGPSTIAVVGDTMAALVKFCDKVEQPWAAIRKISRAMDRSVRATNPQCFKENGTWKRGQKFIRSQGYLKLQARLAEQERQLAATRKCAHGALANQILALGNVIQTEKISYRALQKNYGKSVKVRAPGMFIDLLRRKAESADGQFVELHTWTLKMSQYDHISDTYTKKALNVRWHPVSDGSGFVQRDIYSAFLAACVQNNQHHPSYLLERWAAQKPVLLQMGWYLLQPATVCPLGHIPVVMHRWSGSSVKTQLPLV